MREIFYLLRRNILLYFRDYTAVFFSLMSMLIVLALMVIFLGNMNSENVVYALEEFGGVRDQAADKANATYLIQMWTLAGILVVNTVTVTLTVTGKMVEDEVSHKLVSLYVAPVKRIKIALGYIGAAWFAGAVMSLFTLAAGEVYMVFCSHPLRPADSLWKLTGMILLNAFVYAALSYLSALLVHSNSAWGGLQSIVGTLVGFVGAIYLPVSMLPDGVMKALKCLPVLHGAAIMREICIQDALEETFFGLPEAAKDIFREQMGVTVMVGNGKAKLWQQVALLLGYGIIAVAASAMIMKRRRLHDR